MVEGLRIFFDHKNTEEEIAGNLGNSLQERKPNSSRPQDIFSLFFGSRDVAQAGVAAAAGLFPAVAQGEPVLIGY